MWTIKNGDVIDVLDSMDKQSVHCVVTSPPYYGLRNYDLPPTVWGGQKECSHYWSSSSQPPTKLGMSGNTNGISKNFIDPGKIYAPSDVPLHGMRCMECDAWSGCLGLEPTIEMFVEHIVYVFSRVWRVLRNDGTVWLNLGDSYAGSGRRTEKHSNPGINKSVKRGGVGLQSHIPPGVKRKDLMGMPWRVALALQASGWYLRSDIIWQKLNALPESVRDRPSKSHEYIFLLTKNEKYFYDNDAIRQPLAESSIKRLEVESFWDETGGDKDYNVPGMSSRKTLENLKKAYDEEKLLGANKRTVWPISSGSLKLHHYATFPIKMVEPCIMAGTSEHGVCRNCGKPYRRIIERKSSTMNLRVRDAKKGISEYKTGFDGSADATNKEILNYSKEESVKIQKGKTKWIAGCKCNDTLIPATVMDIFSGSGTTGLVSLRHGRSYVGIELNQKYVDISRERIIGDAPLFNTITERKGD